MKKKTVVVLLDYEDDEPLEKILMWANQEIGVLGARFRLEAFKQE